MRLHGNGRAGTLIHVDRDFLGIVILDYCPLRCLDDNSVDTFACRHDLADVNIRFDVAFPQVIEQRFSALELDFNDIARTGNGCQRGFYCQIAVIDNRDVDLRKCLRRRRRVDAHDVKPDTDGGNDTEHHGDAVFFS